VKEVEKKRKKEEQDDIGIKRILGYIFFSILLLYI
jgi:hypothetical protein